MIVADTSALISLAAIDLLELFLTEFDVHTTRTVLEELEETSDYDDSHGEAAEKVLRRLDKITVHGSESDFESSRVDEGEGSCAVLSTKTEAKFLITDDLRALPELEKISDSHVAISPVVLKALVKRDVLERKDALDRIDELAEKRDWLGAPIYRRAKSLFD